MNVNRSPMSYEVTDRLLQLGYSEAFAVLVGEQMNTDFVAKMMLGYLRDARPTTMEEVADEMLGILELRQRCIQNKMNRG